MNANMPSMAEDEISTESTTEAISAGSTSSTSSPRDPKLAVAILAAGASRRLGQPKQLVRIEGITLLQRAIDTARTTGAARVLLLLGAHADACWASLRTHDGVERVDVETHAEGMSASLRAAVARIEHAPAIEHLLLMLVDQYAVDDAWLAALRTRATAFPQRIVASRYEGVRGAPALFPRTMFSALAMLRGDQGARALLREESDPIDYDALHAPGDVDTPTQIPP
jgi:molybdenum cofactor cytidylyltransferase